MRLHREGPAFEAVTVLSNDIGVWSISGGR